QSSIDPERQFAHAGAQIGDHSLARNGGLTFGDQRAHAVRQIDIDARSKADHANPLAGADTYALAREADDAACNQAGTLHHPDAALAGRDDKGISFIVLARLVELGIDEGAGLVGYFFNTAAHWAAVHVAIEHVHKNRHALQRALAEAGFGRRHRIDDLGDAP